MEQTSASSGSPLAKPGVAKNFGPPARQLWINLKAWAPFFRNPQERDRLASYPSQDYRVGLKWRIVFPKQCWHCQQTAHLVPQESLENVRAFEHALSVVAGVAAAWMFAALICFFSFWTAFVMFAFLTAIGGAVLMLKSWVEPATLVSWHCKEHLDSPEALELAIEDGKMLVILPTSEMAREAASEIAALRKRGPGAPNVASTGGGPPPPKRDASLPDAPIRPYSPAPPIVQEELPPIRLAGEDDE